MPEHESKVSAKGSVPTDFTVHQLTVFRTVALLLSYTKAAEALYLSQPAVTQQVKTLELALGLLERASGARTTMQSPLRWSEDARWKLDYNNIAQMSPEELARRRSEFDKQKEIARGNRAA